MNKRFGFEIHRHKKSIGIVTTIKGNYGEKNGVSSNPIKYNTKWIEFTFKLVLMNFL